MPNDHGPIYLETLMGRFPVEPWNTISNLLFLALIIYWFARVRGDVAVHRFIAYSLPVLLIGWAGGTVYHATRSHDVWLFLDFGPIALLVLAVAVFFWRRQGVAWWWVPALVFGPAALIFPVMVGYRTRHAPLSVTGHWRFRSCCPSLATYRVRDGWTWAWSSPRSPCSPWRSHSAGSTPRRRSPSCRWAHTGCGTALAPARCISLFSTSSEAICGRPCVKSSVAVTKRPEPSIKRSECRHYVHGKARVECTHICHALLTRVTLW